MDLFCTGDDGLDAPSAVGLKLLAHAIMDIASELNVRLDTFSLGQVANMIGKPFSSHSLPHLGILPYSSLGCLRSLPTWSFCDCTVTLATGLVRPYAW